MEIIFSEEKRKTEGFIPLSVPLLYIRRLRLLQEWINLCRSIYPEAHPSVSANFSRVIFWASRKVLMSSPIGVKSNPYLFFLFFSISICPPPVLKFVMFHFTEIEVPIKRDRISMYRNYKCYIGEQLVRIILEN